MLLKAVAEHALSAPLRHSRPFPAGIGPRQRHLRGREIRQQNIGVVGLVILGSELPTCSMIMERLAL
jgi:phosphoglycerate dehydrogenase-like enzyme